MAEVTHHSERGEDAAGSACNRKQETFEKQLPDQPATTGSESRPNREFGRANYTAAKEKVRDVQTGDKQNERHRCQKQDGGRAKIPSRENRELLLHAVHNRNEITLPVSSMNGFMQREQFRLSLGSRDARPQARESDGDQPVARPWVLACEKYPKLRLARIKLEAGRHNADYGARAMVK